MAAPRRVSNGAATNDLVFSAYADGNDNVFPRIPYVKPGSVVADVTYGKGVFWRRVPSDRYDLRTSDIMNGVDCRNLPYRDGQVDCVVLDPPYMHSPGGTAHRSHEAFEEHYRNNGSRSKHKYHEAVLDLYRGAGVEAHRVLRDRGVFIVKCQDEVCSNRQRFTHVEIMASYDELGFRSRRPLRDDAEQPTGREQRGPASARPKESLLLPGLLEGTGQWPANLATCGPAIC